MRLTALFPHWHGLRVKHVCVERDHLTLIAETIPRAARCPLCHRASRAVHSRYQRRVADLPCGDRAVGISGRTAYRLKTLKRHIRRVETLAAATL